MMRRKLQEGKCKTFRRKETRMVGKENRTNELLD